MKGYYLVGKPDVPEEKKTELAEKILQIMYKGGLRLADRDRYLVEKPKINDDGVIKVNYSIFENEVWDEIGMKLMTVRIIQSENKRPYSSYVTVGKLAEWMGCEKSEVELLLDYTSEFDDMVLTRNVIRKCQKQKIISYDNEITYYTWFLMNYGKLLADKDKERDIVIEQMLNKAI